MSSYTTLFIIFTYVAVSLVNAKNGGFSTRLYTREGPGSPFYDPTLTKADRFNRAIDRDFARMNRSKVVTPNSPITDLKAVEGTFLMKLAVGTPPYEFFASADTGSEQTWLQCQPCNKCFRQLQPIFDPRDSPTYRVVECLGNHQGVVMLPCPNFQGVSCVGHVCNYVAEYGDGTVSKGVLSTDILTMQSTTDEPFTLPNYIFGCGWYNDGDFVPEAAGVIGLGRGPRSLITQLGGQINGKFSYCLYPSITGGKIHFGDEATVAGPDVITTPLIARDGADTFAFYYATLEALTIGNERVPFARPGQLVVPGNIIVDSGATLIHLPQYFYKNVVAAVKRQVSNKPARSPRPELKVCFQDSDPFPSTPLTLIAHFSGGDVVLKDFNLFQLAGGVMCLGITQGPIAIWGNTGQWDFLVGFDVPAGTVSFKATECE